MLSRIVLFLVGVAATAATAGCGGEGAEREQVVAAFYPLAFAAEQIGAGELEVVNLTPAGVEPHDLELTARQVADVRNASLVLYLGGGFQPALERAVAEREGKSLDLLPGPPLLRRADGDGAGDPHVWLDPRRFARIVRAVGKALARDEAASRLARRLEELDEEIATGLADCERRRIVTSHAAFAYLAARYQLEQVPLTGLAPEVEPSPRALAALVDRVREEGATTVFFEPLVSPALARTVAREAGVATATLDPLEGLTEEQAARGGDYLTVMRENLSALRAALGCR